MNELIFNNQDLELKIRAIKNADGSISINAEDTAIGFGWTKTETKGNKKYTTIRWKRMNDFLNELGFRPQVGEGDYIPESVFYLLGMKAQNETALRFQNWLALDVIPSIRKTGSYSANKPQCIEDVLISSLQEMKALRLEINNTKEEVNGLKEENQNIRDLVALSPNQWREDTTKIINKIATKLGGYTHIEVIRKESYKILNSTYGVDVNRRLLNKKKNMALEGCSKSKIAKVNVLDVIAEDKKLIQGYVSIVSKMAIKYGI